MHSRRLSPIPAPALDRPAWQTYGFAAVMLGLALLTRWLIDPLVGPHMPLATMYVGVVLAAWFGGWIPASVTAVLGYFLALWIFQPGPHAGQSFEALGLPRFFLYGLSTAVTVLLIESIRRAERRHASSESKVLGILENMHECFCAVDRQWRLTAVNRAAEGYLGQTRDALLGRTFWSLFPGAVGQQAEQELRRALDSRQTVRFETNTFIPRSWHAVTAIPVKDGLSLFCHDVTASRAQLDELERQVADRTAALQQLVSELEAFSYTLVHDMRAPLRSISSFAEILAVDHAHQLDSAGKSHLSRIQRSAGRMDQLIVDILEYSQLSRRRPELRSIDLDELVRDLVRSQPDFNADRADVAIVGPLPRVLGNQALLAQCFSNLLHNAIKFVAPGAKPRVRVSWEPRDGLARVMVADNGIGVPADATVRIFEPFRREHPNYDGTGIGLAIVRKVVDQMGGRVGVESEVGRGSTFWVEIPLAAASATANPLLGGHLEPARNHS